MAMPLEKILYMQTSEYRLKRIPELLDKRGITFSQTEAAKLLGGRGKLLRLMESGEIRVEKKALYAQNGKWYCRAGDVLRHMKL